MKSFAIGGLAVAATFAFAGLAGAETYVRAGKEKINVVDKGGRLYCTRVSDGYEMCNGMLKQQDGSWKGKKMKHPDMPRWMSFNGTVIFTTAGLSIKGCAVGMCDSESWAKVK
ncbi:hypothetical protein [Marimonas arenosa]|uniref:DUF2147 domain-containing protein n=1 Tax=Marimonas arenosa TaxID=1795305 RepID=A0AAE4B5A1_9RHOB|nr:hypothetical protein [Marimonas arenosa]MDQ2091848.1 hypothetical protein [Marimonas arenosa]